MSLDAGTTSNRCIIFNKSGQIISSAGKEFTQFFPKPGWVEHDATEIWSTQIGVAAEALSRAKLKPKDIETIGITNQRETVVMWDKITGQPVYHAIVWQCRRTSAYCDELKEKGYTEFFKKKTGLVLDAYFSATKIKWILDNVDGVREKAEKGEILFGTIETWLIWNLTGGKVYITDYSNASRTMLFNIHTLTWDDEILELLDIPKIILPKVKPSSHHYGDAEYFGELIPITGAAGDQQAALFGHTCFEKGAVKNTYGTGGFLLVNTGEEPVDSKEGLLTTLAWGIDDKVTYALEGSIFVAGAVVQWLRDELGLIKNAKESEKMAMLVEDTKGCYVVPAFTGLGAPYWNQEARGTIVGLTRGVNKNHIVRAALESIAYQVQDVLKIMEKEVHIDLENLRVDGGASGNDFLLQFQSDIIGVPVVRPKCIETTALGAAYLAGLQTGYWKDKNDIISNVEVDKIFRPNMEDELRDYKLERWHKAVTCSLDWAKGERYN